MEYLVVSLAALGAALLTLFSGFGLGTLLMPVAALFFPLPVAVALTAVVHLANNVFKVALVGAHAHRGVMLLFGVPAVLAAFLGAWSLARLAALPPLFSYTALGRELAVSPVKLTIGLLILAFVLLERSPALARASLPPRYLPFGGCISGFFGGLSGHQGAFRSLFLLKAGLDKTQFIATGAILATMVDAARTLVYGFEAATAAWTLHWGLVAAATAAAFLGSFIGSRLIKKVTLRGIQLLVSALLTAIALGLISGAI